MIMQKIIRKSGFVAILLSFTLLYIATSKKDNLTIPPCNDCVALAKADSILRKNTRILNSFSCNEKKYCLYVKDTARGNVQIVADTACTVLKSVGALDYDVRVLWINKTLDNKTDTLINQKCL
jgi:hypothetical protein